MLSCVKALTLSLIILLMVSCQHAPIQVPEVVAPVVVKPLVGEAYLEDIEKKLRDSILPAGVVFERTESQLLLNIQCSLLFETDKFEFRYEASKVIEPLRKTLSEFPPASVDIKSYTDSLGPISWNQRLSEYRAKALLDYLIAGGLKAESLMSAGFGSQDPIESNSTDLGRQANRRLEVRIFPNKPDPASQP